MPRKTKPLPGMKGIYPRRNGVLWLRYTHEGKQLRVPLGTTDEAEAITKAKEIRNRPETPKPPKISRGDRPTWKACLDSYIADKLAGRKSPFVKHNRQRTFRPGTAKRTRDILRLWGENSGTRSPFDVTAANLESAYLKRKQSSVASAKTITDRVCSFLEHLGHFPKKPEYSEKDQKEIREVFLEPNEYTPLIDDCENRTLKFILFAGFHCGLRKAEIIYARPQWFHLTGDDPFVRIPPHEKQKFADGTVYEWRSKNGKKKREVPLGKVFAEWLRENLDMDAPYAIRPKACGTWRYRYDFKKSFATYMKAKGRPEVNTHAMRHTYITRLCRSGEEKITIMLVSEWSGDEIETIQRHYWHKGGVGGGDAYDRAISGEKKESTEDAIGKVVERKIDEGVAKIMQMVSAGLVTPAQGTKSVSLATKGDTSLMDDLLERYWVRGTFGGEPTKPLTIQHKRP